MSAAARALLATTERLAACLAEDAAVETLAAAFRQRERAFDVLREATLARGGRPEPGSRDLLAQVAELDRAMTAAGGALLAAIAGERQALARRRTAVGAHAAREREAPRLVTLRA